MELKSLHMAIHSLFHAASTRLQSKERVAAGDSHRQLDMVNPEHSPQERSSHGSPEARGSPQTQHSLPSPMGSLGSAGDTRRTRPFPAGGGGSGVCGAGGVGDGREQGMQGCRDPDMQGQGCRDPDMQRQGCRGLGVCFHAPTEAHSGAACAFLSRHSAWGHLPSKEGQAGSASCSHSCPQPTLSLPTPDPAVHPRPPGLHGGHEGEEPSPVRAAGKGQNPADCAD